MARTAPGLLALVVSLGGCHTTSVLTQAKVGRGGVREERQWFVAGGLVPVSEPAGQVCVSGVARVQSGADALDTWLQVGLWAAAAAVWSASMVGCDITGGSSGGACVAAGVVGGALLPWTVSSRTLRYVCVDEVRSSAVEGPVPVITPPVP